LQAAVLQRWTSTLPYEGSVIPDRTAAAAVAHRLVLLILCLAVLMSAVSLSSPLPKRASQPPAAALFDLDGTLLDTETLSTAAIQMVLDKYETGKRIEWSLKRQLLGLRGDVWGQMVVDQLGLAGKVDGTTLVAEWEENLNGLCPQVIKMTGALQAVEKCKAVGLRLGIATSSTASAVTSKRAKHEDLFAHMEIVVCGDDREVLRGKPAPDIYLLAAKRLGVEPSRCVVFEDALSGVQSALAAGMFCVAVPDPNIDRAPFETLLLSREGGQEPRGVLLPSLEHLTEEFLATLFNA